MESSHSKPTHLIDLEEPQNLNAQPLEFVVSPEAKEYFKNITKKCFVISISGTPRIGKSSLLNLMSTLFSKNVKDYVNPFKVSQEDISQTKGIDAYVVQDDETAFILLDCEGVNDASRGKLANWIFANLMSIQVCISHVHLYYYADSPQNHIVECIRDLKHRAQQLPYQKNSPVIFIVKKDQKTKDLTKSRSQISQTVSEVLPLDTEYIFPLFRVSDDVLDAITEEKTGYQLPDEPFIEEVKNLKEAILKVTKNQLPYEPADVFKYLLDLIEDNKRVLKYCESLDLSQIMKEMSVKVKESQIEKQIKTLDENVKNNLCMFLFNLDKPDELDYKICSYMVDKERDEVVRFIAFFEKTYLLLDELLPLMRAVKEYRNDPLTDRFALHLIDNLELLFKERGGIIFLLEKNIPELKLIIDKLKKARDGLVASLYASSTMLSAAGAEFMAYRSVALFSGGLAAVLLGVTAYKFSKSMKADIKDKETFKNELQSQNWGKLLERANILLKCFEDKRDVLKNKLPYDFAELRALMSGSKTIMEIETEVDKSLENLMNLVKSVKRVTLDI